MTFFIEVVAGGLLAGVMYALVALGFVLIYKASGVFNFAQGSLVFFAALTFVSLTERGWNFGLALLATLIAMILVGIAIERTVLRPLVNQPPITLLMATIGLTFVLEGASQLMCGFEWIAGAIVGGLIIGAGEKLAEVYLGPYVGGGIESWFAYVIALLFLLVRPEGLFGEKIIDRV